MIVVHYLRPTIHAEPLKRSLGHPGPSNAGVLSCGYGPDRERLG